MIAIPEAIQTLLKSKVMVGENRPTAVLTIEGQPSGGELVGEWTTPRKIRATQDGEDWYAGTWTGGSFVTRSDSKILVTYGNVSEKKIYLSVVDTEDDLYFDDNASVANEWVHETVAYMKTDNKAPYAPSRLFKLSNGTILLFVTDSGYWNSGDIVSPKFKVYQSVNGLGTDFSLLATIEASISGITTYASGQWKSAQLGMPIQLASGRILIPWQSVHEDYYSYPGICDKILYSDDDGETWTSVTLKGPSTTTYSMHWGAMGVFNGRLVIFHKTDYSGGNERFYYSDDEGETWSDTGVTGSGTDYWGSIFGHGAGYTYFLYNESAASGWDVYRCLDTETWDTGNPYPFLASPWEKISTARVGDDELEFIWITEDNRIALAGESIYGGSISYIWGVELAGSAAIPLKSVVVDRVKGGASQATCVIDNAAGYYAPDNADSPFYQVIWPNKNITITMGYGAEQVTVFKGLIDKISMRNYPAELTIESRDYAKRALDQIAQMFYVDHQAYVIQYQSQSPEYIFTDLATKAGWAAGNIHVGTSGLILGEFIASHETYADCFQRLAELTGWEWYCDQDEIYFQAAVDPAPVADYIYSEGEDIFSLGYDFDDSELYRDIVVWSMDGGDPPAAVRATVEWSAADYNNVLDHKTLIVRAPETVLTVDQCEWLAQQIANSITPKPRSVDFVVVGNPYLQMGDCLQVIESTTTISELYRIFELSFAMVADAGNGSPFFANTIRCYHYAYAAVPESVPEEYVAPDPPLVVPDDYQGETFPVYPGGGINVTADIQDMIDAVEAKGGGTVYLPEGEYWIDAETSIVMKSGVNLEMADNAILYAIANDAENYAVIKCSDISNVKISGGQIVGDRNTHTGSSGEWGMGIDIEGCNNIIVSGVKIYNCWGDGIYIGSSETQKYCYNVIVENFLCSNNRRNGISIISGKYITLRNGTINYSKGTLPEDGIDLEPNAADEWMQNILIQNVVSSHNGTPASEFGGADISIWFGCGTENEEALAKSRVSIVIDNLTGTGNVRTAENVSSYIAAGYDITVS